MSKSYNILMAGFGGQGILFAGKVIAYAGLLENKEVSWLPSYGPEMRGGTANCSICISEDSIGSPLVISPNIFVVMNLPSFDKFVNSVQKEGVVIVDSSLIHKRTENLNLIDFYIPATQLAEENNIKGLANMIMLGKMFKETAFCSEESLYKGLEKCISRRKNELFQLNKKALLLGMNYKL